MLNPFQQFSSPLSEVNPELLVRGAIGAGEEIGEGVEAGGDMGELRDMTREADPAHCSLRKAGSQD